MSEAVADDERSQWDLVYRPRRLIIWSCVAAVVVVAIHATFGYLLNKANFALFGHVFNFGDNGVRNIGDTDQWSILLIGVLEAGAILLLTRPRLRVGSRGVGVRNLIGERFFDWDEIVGISYPEKGWSAWLEFPMDEHIPVLAVRSADGEAAVAAMESFRDLQQRYTSARVDDA
ncbi:PH domain-containing protein [Gordonia sp. X0973]|uniref:PH domain-containing protein n=1 Tax=Gordonia sp. X0973 TaxID=2742602 RepID=UPI000F5380FF|nr:PH domain-containing protein [Gordonia sp. X0973]QKT07296.1 PH domain-containing protein [Gordonia sp. X0973]